MAVFPIDEAATTGIVDIQPGSDEMILRQRVDGRGPIPLDQIDQLYFRYMGKEGTEATVNISWLVTPDLSRSRGRARRGPCLYLRSTCFT